MRSPLVAVAIAAMIPATVAARPDEGAEPERGTGRLGSVGPEPGRPAPEIDVGERRARPTTPDPDDATRHTPDAHGGPMPPMGNTGPTHPPGFGKAPDAP